MRASNNSNAARRFWSTITIEVRLNGSMSRLASVLEGIGALRPLSRGSVLRYEVLGNRNVILEFSQQSAATTYYFDEPDIKDRVSALVTLLAALAYAKELYDVKFESAYETVVDLLRQCIQMIGMQHRGEKRGDEAMEERVRALSFSNSNLAHNVVRLHKDSVSAVQVRNAYRDLCLRIVKESYYRGIEGAITELGLDKEPADLIRKHEKGVEHA